MKTQIEILYQENEEVKIRAVAEKWTFQDVFMGDQYVMLTVSSAFPIAWSIGDYVEFRGETYTLNYIPAATQNAGSGEKGNAFVYDNIKFDSDFEMATRTKMLDITPTTGMYKDSLGTNYTGSSIFQLYCGEIEVNGVTLTPVCALAAKIQANFDRAFPKAGWKVYVDISTTYKDNFGNDVLVTHTDDKLISFNNTTIAEAVAEVNKTFELDYCRKGRNIYIGYNLGNLTGDTIEEQFAFGYGSGYPTHEDMHKGLFQIKRMVDSQQQIITRLRAMGSTKNMPYRYYNKAYDLSQALFPTNLQLPGTFLNYSKPTFPRRPVLSDGGKTILEPESKIAANAERDQLYGINPDTNLPWYRHVKGDTNDAYIDKNDDADNCVEGVREECVSFDGSNKDLPEIYPTIVEATFGELRGANVPDQSGTTGVNAFQPSLQPNDERIDELLAIGHYSESLELVDDANIGDGILPENGEIGTGTSFDVEIPSKTLHFINGGGEGNDFTNLGGGVFAGPEVNLLVIRNVAKGSYQLSTMAKTLFFDVQRPSIVPHSVGCKISIRQTSGITGQTITIAEYSAKTSVSMAQLSEMELPSLPQTIENPQVSEIYVSEVSDIAVVLTPLISDITLYGQTEFDYTYRVGKPETNPSDIVPQYTWHNLADSGSLSETFHVFVKDMGFDITACFNGDTPTLAMKSGRCVGREFTIGEEVSKITYQGKRGYMLTLNRAKDESLNTYYPSEVDPIAAGDHFVLLNINMPDAYIRMAEVRLLRAATDYLADNCETRFTYQPSLNNIYLRQNYDNMKAAGTPEKSIFWRLYAGLKFTFRGIPDADPQGDVTNLPLIDITIHQVTIKMGEGLTPKVELTLNDKTHQTTIQKIVTSVDRIYNGSIFSNGMGSGSGASITALLSLLQSEGSKIFLSKQKDDTANGVITHEKKDVHKSGIQIGGQFVSGVGNWPTGRGGLIDDEANAELLSLLVRSFFASTNYRPNEKGFKGWVDDNGNSHFEFDESIVRKELSSIDPREGLMGEGWKIWIDDEGVGHMVVDKLTVRQTMSVLELLIEKVRSTNGSIIVSAANGKIASVEEEGYLYKITFEQPNQFLVDDQIRCATYNGDGKKDYWVRVASVTEDGIYVFKDEFTSDPAVGDECVLMGNRTNTSRQNLIFISASESGQPVIDIYGGVTNTNLVGCLRTRVGCLDGITDSYFGENQPQGMGLYSDNAYLKGRFILINGEDVQTKFEITEGRIQSVVEALREDLDDGSGYLNNPSFSNGLMYWTVGSQSRKFYTFKSNLIMDIQNKLLADEGVGVALSKEEDGRNSIFIPSGGTLYQKNEDMRQKPVITIEDTKKYAIPIYFSMVYKVDTVGDVHIGFFGEDPTGFVAYSRLDIVEYLTLTDGYTQLTGSGYWNGTGDFYIGATNGLGIHIRAIALSTDPIDATTYKYRGFFEQSAKLTKLGNQALNSDGKVIVESGLYTESTRAGLFVNKGDHTIGYMGVKIDTSTDPPKSVIKLTGDDILLEGNITANGNVNIGEDGTITAIEGRFIEGKFTNCELGGYLRTGIDAMQDAPQEAISQRTAFRYVLSKVSNLYASGGNYDIYLPHDPEFIGTHVTIVFDGEITDSTGYRQNYSPTGGKTLRLLTGRALVKHTYQDSLGGVDLGPSYEGNAYNMKRPFYTSVGGGEQGADYEMQNLLWFMGVEPVELQNLGYYNPTILELPEGSAIQLMGVPALQAKGIISQTKYKIDTRVGAVEYDRSGNTPIEEGEDPDYTGDEISLCQWAVVAIRGNLRGSYRSGIYPGWGYNNTQDYIEDHPSVTTPEPTAEPTQAPTSEPGE